MSELASDVALELSRLAREALERVQGEISAQQLGELFEEIEP